VGYFPNCPCPPESILHLRRLWISETRPLFIPFRFQASLLAIAIKFSEPYTPDVYCTPSRSQLACLNCSLTAGQKGSPYLDACKANHYNVHLPKPPPPPFFSSHTHFHSPSHGRPALIQQQTIHIRGACHKSPSGSVLVSCHYGCMPQSPFGRVFGNCTCHYGCPSGLPHHLLPPHPCISITASRKLICVSAPLSPAPPVPSYVYRSLWKNFARFGLCSFWLY
jgi:hypothetical protein